jgi:hypothetical protein
VIERLHSKPSKHELLGSNSSATKKETSASGVKDSYAGGRDQEDRGSRLAQARKS